MTAVGKRLGVIWASKQGSINLYVLSNVYTTLRDTVSVRTYGGGGSRNSIPGVPGAGPSGLWAKFIGLNEL